MKNGEIAISVVVIIALSLLVLIILSTLVISQTNRSREVVESCDTYGGFCTSRSACIAQGGKAVGESACRAENQIDYGNNLVGDRLLVGGGVCCVT